jgi:phospholipase C
MSDVVHALMKSPQWSRLALFITWDENGGFYDHVPPPPACVPDDSVATGNNGPVPGATFDRLGFRVPMIVVSPYAKKGYVAHTTYSHSSILRFIQAKFKVPALTARDANAEVPFEMFDFQNPAFMTPPDVMEPTVDPTALQYCEATY